MSTPRITFQFAEKAYKSIESCESAVRQIAGDNPDRVKFTEQEFDSEFVYFRVAIKKAEQQEVIDLIEKTRFALVSEKWVGGNYIGEYKAYI